MTKKKGSAAGTVEPQIKSHLFKLKGTGQKKQPDCEWYPDVKPSAQEDKSGTTTGRVSIILPVFIARRKGGQGRTWHYLGVCSCGTELIFCNTTKTRSCGCIRGEAIARRFARMREERAARIEAGEINPSVYKTPSKRSRKKEFDRYTTCTRNEGQWLCEHYHRCQDERLETGKVSARYRPGCYAVSKDEEKYDSTISGGMLR